jgi:sugar/nucleoside kinase (ribokinase family)
MPSSSVPKVIGVGSPIVDRLARVPESFVASIEGEKGGMVLVDREAMTALIGRVEGQILRAPGGSAANTTYALAKMGLPAAFLGKVGDDEDGQYYLQAFGAAGGDCTRFRRTTDRNTACCLSLVTPDSDRTMRTDLGAAMLLDPGEIGPEDFAGCAHAHIEGYLLFNRPLTEAVLDAARRAGCTISLDLGSFEVVRAAAEVLPALLDEYVDAVFANEDEARMYIGEDNPERALAVLGELCGTVAVKLGARGALLRRASETAQMDAVPADPVTDTTGAGDCWAAGFLYGWLHDWPLDACGRLGAVLGAETVRHLGALPPEPSWDRIRAEMKR